jgi:hypothetical protein
VVAGSPVPYSATVSLTEPDLLPEKEKEFRRDLVLRALQILKEDVHE